MKHTFFLLEPGHRCYWWGTIESILTHPGDAFFLWCVNIPTWRNEQRAAMVVRGGIWGRKPRCTSHLKRSRKARTAVFFLLLPTDYTGLGHHILLKQLCSSETHNSAQLLSPPCHLVLQTVLPFHWRLEHLALRVHPGADSRISAPRLKHTRTPSFFPVTWFPEPFSSLTMVLLVANQETWASQVALVMKNLPIMRETQETGVRFLGLEAPVEEEMVTHSSVLAWRIPWTVEPGGLQSKGSQRVAQNDWEAKHTQEA